MTTFLLSAELVGVAKASSADAVEAILRDLERFIEKRYPALDVGFEAVDISEAGA